MSTEFTWLSPPLVFHGRMDMQIDTVHRWRLDIDSPFVDFLERGEETKDEYVNSDGQRIDTDHASGWQTGPAEYTSEENSKWIRNDSLSLKTR